MSQKSHLQKATLTNDYRLSDSLLPTPDYLKSSDFSSPQQRITLEHRFMSGTFIDHQFLFLAAIEEKIASVSDGQHIIIHCSPLKQHRAIYFLYIIRCLVTKAIESSFNSDPKSNQEAKGLLRKSKHPCPCFQMRCMDLKGISRMMPAGLSE